MNPKPPIVTRLLAMVALFMVSTGISSDIHAQGQAQAPASRIDANPVGIVSTPARNLLMKSSQALRNSKPLQAKSRMRVQMFDQQVVAHGNYWQAGQGTGSARWEYTVPVSGSTAATSIKPDSADLFLLQVCHRGFYYRLQTGGEEPKLDYADLRQLSKADDDFLFARQGAWMATGGVSGLLELLATNFKFADAQRIKVGSNDVWKMSGGWNEERLRRLLNGQVVHGLIRDEIKWLKLPKQVPHSCEILIAADDYFPGFPYRLTFFQKRDLDGVVQNKPMVSIEFYELQTDVNLDEAMFDVNFDGIKPEDMTDSFVQRIEALQRARRSARQKRALSR